MWEINLGAMTFIMQVASGKMRRYTTETTREEYAWAKRYLENHIGKYPYNDYA